MERRREPDVKIGKILDAAEKLFMEKGYENTTIADIQHAAGLSRGAIYHHFPVNAKEEIINAITKRMYHNGYGYDESRDEGCNALEKFRRQLVHTYRSHTEQDIFLSSSALLKNPKYLAMQLQECIEIAVPRIQKLIEEGNRDGSTQVEDVEAMAEMVALHLNIWCIPAVFPGAASQALARFRFLGKQAGALGMPFVDEELIEAYREYAERYAVKP